MKKRAFIGTKRDGCFRTFLSRNKIIKAVKCHMSNYHVVDILRLYGHFKDKIYNYKMRHIKLGKLHYKGNPFQEWNGYEDFTIKGMSWGLHWQTNIYLATIIRDYLRDFNKKTPATGNCVLKDNPEGIPYEDFFDNTYDGDIDFGERWNKQVEKVADEFDELLTFKRIDWHNCENCDEITAHTAALTKKAFADLVYIFDDLEW